MINSKNKVNSIFFRNIFNLVLSIIVFFCISIKKSEALPHEWVGVPKSEYGEQLWDRKSIKRNEDGSVRVLSKFIPNTKSEIAKDILYTMDINCFEKSYREYKQSQKQINLCEIYLKKLEITDNKTTTTNKWLFNYQYAGIIAKAIPNAKIIHCYRNPLDNILSTYRAHFATGNNFSSSLVDSAEVYSDQDEIMQTYKKEFKNHIYSLNYDELVTHPSKEIKSLICWLGWNWNDLYLSPHLNNRKVSTRSNVQVRSPINTKSLGGWKNYKEMLRPAMEIITKKNKYKDLKY